MECKHLTDSVVASVIPQYEFLGSLLGVMRTSVAHRHLVLWTEALNMPCSDHQSCPSQAFHEEYSRLYQLAKETPTAHSDPRLQHVLVYFFQNEAPKRVVERTLLEQFADKNLSYDERWDESPTASGLGPVTGSDREVAPCPAHGLWPLCHTDPSASWRWRKLNWRRLVLTTWIWKSTRWSLFFKSAKQKHEFLRPD